MTKKKTKVVVKKKEIALVPVTDFQADSGKGFETADRNAYAIPFLTILQDLSPQVKKSSPEYINGAEAGMLYNSVTEKFYDGEEGILIIPVFYHRNFIEWTPRSSGGGFVAIHSTEPEGAKWTEDNNYCLSNGNELTDTRNHYIIMVEELKPALICMSRTQLKKSKKWMSQLQALKFEGTNKKLFTPPMFANVFKISTIIERKDNFQWFGFKLERVRDVTIKEYTVSKGFLDAVKEQKTVTDYSVLNQKTDLNESESETHPEMGAGAKKGKDPIPF